MFKFNRHQLVLLAFFSVLMSSLNMTRAQDYDSSDLISILDRYKEMYFSKEVSDKDLLDFFDNGVTEIYQKDKEQGLRFSEGWVPRILNSPIRIEKYDSKTEVECESVEIENSLNNKRCLLVTGNNRSGVKEKIAFSFSLDNDLRIVNTTTFGNVQ